MCAHIHIHLHRYTQPRKHTHTHTHARTPPPPHPHVHTRIHAQRIEAERQAKQEADMERRREQLAKQQAEQEKERQRVMESRLKSKADDDVTIQRALTENVCTFKHTGAELVQQDWCVVLLRAYVQHTYVQRTYVHMFIHITCTYILTFTFIFIFVFTFIFARYVLPLETIRGCCAVCKDRCYGGQELAKVPAAEGQTFYCECGMQGCHSMGPTVEQLVSDLQRKGEVYTDTDFAGDSALFRKPALPASQRRGMHKTWTSYRWARPAAFEGVEADKLSLFSNEQKAATDDHDPTGLGNCFANPADIEQVCAWVCRGRKGGDDENVDVDVDVNIWMDG